MKNNALVCAKEGCNARINSTTAIVIKGRGYCSRRCCALILDRSDEDKKIRSLREMFFSTAGKVEIGLSSQR